MNSRDDLVNYMRESINMNVLCMLVANCMKSHYVCVSLLCHVRELKLFSHLMPIKVEDKEWEYLMQEREMKHELLVYKCTLEDQNQVNQDARLLAKHVFVIKRVKSKLENGVHCTDNIIFMFCHNDS